MDEFDFEFDDLESTFDFEFDSFVIIEHGGESYMVKHLLAYDGTSITENGEALTFAQLYSMLMELPDFVVLVHNNYAYHPNGVSREQIVFAASYPVNGYDRAHRITMLASGAVTMTETESEHTSSRVNAITDLNKDSATKYTSVKAVADYVAGATTPIKEDLSTKVGYSEVVNGQLLMYSDSSKEHLLATLDLPSGGGVSDVQVAGTSVVQDGVASVPVATTNIPGVIMVGSGLELPPSNKLRVWQAPDSTFRIGTDIGGFLPASKQHISAFYGLAKAAGHDERDSTLPVGQYTPEAQEAIQQMLGILSSEEVLF